MAVEKVEELPKLVKDGRQRQYLPGDKLGAGGFASVWKAKVIDRRLPPEATECALKVVKSRIKAEQMRTRFKFELAIHNKLRHPNIVEFYRAFTVDDLTYVSLELCHNGSLTDMVRRRKYLTMGEIRRFLIQLSGAVKHLHKRDVVHRDIKAGNIFLDACMNVKLGDFGLASIMVPQNGDTMKYIRRTTFCGTPNYLAPELLSRGGHNKSVDIWAIGILAYFLAVGRAPFHSKSREEIYDRVRRSDYCWPENDAVQNDISEDLKSFVNSVLVPEDQRPSPDTLVRHSFFSEGYIPSRIDALARTRQPRLPRALSHRSGDSRDVYEDLCRASNVGTLSTETSGQMAPPPRREEELLLKSLEREHSAQIELQIPLPNGAVYDAWRPAAKKARIQPSVPVIYEDPVPLPAAGLSEKPKTSRVNENITSTNSLASLASDARIDKVLTDSRSVNTIAGNGMSWTRSKRPRRAAACYE